MRSSFLPWMIVKIRDNELKCLLAAVISVSDQKKIIKSEEQEKEPQLNRNGNREAVLETGEGSTMPGTKIHSEKKRAQNPWLSPLCVCANCLSFIFHLYQAGIYHLPFLPGRVALRTTQGNEHPHLQGQATRLCKRAICQIEGEILSPLFIPQGKLKQSTTFNVKTGQLQAAKPLSSTCLLWSPLTESG